MLKNKFGMTKILVLVLSVLMLVSLVACNKAEGPSTDDMNAAIQAAIDAANAEAAAREAALASSLKAEADKAASEAAAKAAAEASKEASKLAADLAAAEAAASKAQAEASKAAESAKQASIAASKAQAEASKTAAATTNPGAAVDKSEVLAEYSKLKLEYTYTNVGMYKAADYAELVALFDKASLDLNNAATVEAATAVLEALKVDAAAIRSVKIAADEVATLVNALGDIETEVFTTQIEKIAEAQKAYEALKKEYYEYLGCSDKGVAKDAAATDKIATKLGINLADLAKADAKAQILKSYAVNALQSKMDYLYKEYAGKIDKFDTDDLANNEELVDTIYNAYYIYRVLTVVNGGDLTDADLPIDWELKVDDEGKVIKGQYDKKKPIAWFTTDELVDTFILPTLDYHFAAYNAALVEEFETGMTALAALTYVTIDAKDVDTDDVVDALEDAYEALSFVNDFKATATFDDAVAEANIIAIKAYVDAMNVYLAVAKEAAIEAETERVEGLVEGVEEEIDALKDRISDTESATTLERLNNSLAKYEAKIVKLNADLAAYIANVQATTLLTFEEMLNEELNESKTYENKWIDITDFEQVDATAKITGFLHLVLKETIAANFVSEIEVENVYEDESEEELAELVEYLVNDLLALRVRVSPFVEDEDDADIFTDKRGAAYAYMGDYYYENTVFFEDVVAIIDAAIADIEAVSASDFEATNEPVPNSDGKKAYYFKSASAQAYFVEKEMTIEEVIKDSTLTGTTATEWPVTYVYTAAEKAAEKVATLYVDAFNAVNTQLITKDDLASGYKTQISDTSKDEKNTNYDKVVKAATGALKTEMQTVGNKYLTAIDTAKNTFKNQFDSELKVGVFFTKNTKLQSKIENMVKITVPTKSYAEDYDHEGYKAAMQKAVDDFNKNFFIGAPSAELTNVKSYELWTYKLAAVAKIESDIAAYKNTYTALKGENAGMYAVTATNKYTYTAGEDVLEGAALEILTKDAKAVAYEAALDALIDTYTAKIMAVEIGTGTLTIKDGMGNVVDGFNGKEKTEADVDDDYAHTQVNYDLAKGKAAIDAYVKALFGDPSISVKLNYATDNTTYTAGNSEIFKVYNTEILKNAYGYAQKVAE